MEEYFVFEDHEFGVLDVFTDDETVYFQATRCAELLGHRNPYRAVQANCQRIVQRVVDSHFKPDVKRSINFVPLDDLYRLIDRSEDVRTARGFERWINDIVLYELQQGKVEKTRAQTLIGYPL